jgi:hypothetical protein
MTHGLARRHDIFTLLIWSQEAALRSGFPDEGLSPCPPGWVGSREGGEVSAVPETHDSLAGPEFILH